MPTCSTRHIHQRRSVKGGRESDLPGDKPRSVRGDKPSAPLGVLFLHVRSGWPLQRMPKLSTCLPNALRESIRAVRLQSEIFPHLQGSDDSRRHRGDDRWRRSEIHNHGNSRVFVCREDRRGNGRRIFGCSFMKSK